MEDFVDGALKVFKDNKDKILSCQFINLKIREGGRALNHKDDEGLEEGREGALSLVESEKKENAFEHIS